MKHYKVVLTDLFWDSFDRIMFYIQDYLINPFAAKRYKKLFEEAIAKVVSNNQNNFPKIRKIRVKRFSILYYVDEETSTAYVLSIVHNSTNWQDMLQ